MATHPKSLPYTKPCTRRYSLEKTEDAMESIGMSRAPHPAVKLMSELNLFGE
jgi:hypothetical protein